MRISINHKEFLAIHFAVDQIESEIESSQDNEWNVLANEALQGLYSITGKYRKSRANADELNEVIAEVRKQNHYNITGNEAAKIARKAIKRYYQEKNDTD